MKHILFALLLPALLSAQSVTYTYSLDTFHNGAKLRVDSLYLIETVTGFLVNSDATLSTVQRGDREQSLETPIFFSDTAALTRYAENLLQDSLNLFAKIENLKIQADIAGAKARAIQHVRDSVIYGAWLYERENPYQFNPGDIETSMGSLETDAGIYMEAGTGVYMEHTAGTITVSSIGYTENWLDQYLETRYHWAPFMEQTSRQKSPPKKE